MTLPSSSPNSRQDANNWAQPVDKLSVGGLPAEAINLNVQGRRMSGLLQGFGQMWQKTYRIRLPGAHAAPAEVVSIWKANFSKFWAGNNRFYSSVNGVAPGNVAVLNLSMPGGGVLSTGIRVIYADDESFSFMTPQGHIFAGMITFSTYADGEDTVAQIQALIRASDPLYEIGFRLGFGHDMEDHFWQQTLKNLAAHFAVDATAEKSSVCVDKRVQWAEAKNIWHNAAVRTALYMPIHLVKQMFRRSP